MSLQTLKQSAGHLNVFLYTRAQEWLVEWSQSEHIPKNPVCFSVQSSVNMSEVFYNLKLPDNLIHQSIFGTTCKYYWQTAPVTDLRPSRVHPRVWVGVWCSLITAPLMKKSIFYFMFLSFYIKLIMNICTWQTNKWILSWSLTFDIIW